MKSCIFWHITPCIQLKINQGFGGTCRLHLQGRRISKSRNRHEVGNEFAWRIIRLWKWRQHVPPKHRLTFNGIHGITSQTTEPFITTAVRTSNPRILIFYFGSSLYNMSRKYLCYLYMILIHTLYIKYIVFLSYMTNWYFRNDIIDRLCC
jgi:hypothetical protein